MVDLFNVNANVAVAEERVSNQFKPMARKGIANVYEAVVRFIPNPANPADKSVVSKYTVYLKNALKNISKEVDCPSTVGEPDPIQNTFFELRNHPDPVLKANAANFSRKQRFTSLVQVISCKSEPALVGKILIWQYGTKIHEKITSEINPPVGRGYNPFNLTSGRPFYVKVKEVNKFNNFDECRFVDGGPETAVQIPINTKNGVQNIAITEETIANEQVRAAVSAYLTDNCPSLEPYEYHPWTDEIRAFVNECIQIGTNKTLTLQAANMAANSGFQGAPMTQQAAAPVVDTTFSAAPIQTGMPTMGNDPVPQATAPGGFSASNIPSLDDVLGGTQPAQPAPASGAPAGGIDLSDVLGGII